MREGCAYPLTQYPLVVNLVAALFQLVRDDAAHDRARQLQQSKEDFAFGIESHMARIAFDKHVEFCEAYATEPYETIPRLFNNSGDDVHDLATRLLPREPASVCKRSESTR